MDDLLVKSPEFIDRLFGKVVAGFHLIPDVFSICPELQPNHLKIILVPPCRYFGLILIFYDIK